MVKMSLMKEHCSALMLFLLLLPALAVGAPWDDIEESEIRGYKLFTVFKPGDIPAIFEPEFIAVSEADDYYYPGEPLIVVTDREQARAYSTWHLEEHLVVNDYIDGRAITVTW
jgi:hypothetical protein